MVGKPFRKKQVVNQHERSADAVVVDFHSLFSSATAATEAVLEDLPTEIRDLFSQLQREESSMGQTRLLQAQKRKMRSLLTSVSQPMSASQLRSALTALLRLYLLPAYFAFQTSMEWISSCFAELKVNVQGVEVLQIIAQVAEEVLQQADQHLTAASSLDCATILSWLPTFAALSLIDREFQWLSSTSLVRFLDILIRILTRSTKQLGCLDSSEASQTSLLSVPEMIQWGTCCTECMRNTVTVVKSRKQSLNATSDEFASRFQVLHKLSLSILSQDNLSTKDAYTAAGATAMLMHYFTVASSTIPGFVEESAYDLVVRISREGELPWSQLGLSTQMNQPRFVSSPTSKCALIRGFMNVYDLQSLLHVRDNKSLFLEVVLDSVLYFSVNGNSTSQLYALQTLEVWVNKLSELGKRSEDTHDVTKYLEISVVARRLIQVSKVLCASWGHPARQVSHIVPSIYEQLVKSMIGLYGCPALTAESSLTEQINVTVGNISSASGLWQAILREALMMPSFHRGKYNAMKILMEHMGAELFFNLQPGIVMELVNAMKDRDISASVGALLCSIIKHLTSGNADKTGSNKQVLAPMKSMVHVWEKEVVIALTSNNKAWRNNVADYLLSELVKLETGSIVHVLGNLLQEEAVNSCKLWCVVQLVLNARLSALPLPVDVVQVQRIQQYLSLASDSADDHLRLAALIAMTASLKASAPVSHEDFALFAEALEKSLKTSDVDQCSKINRALRNLLVRAKASTGKTADASQHVGFDQVVDWILTLVQKNLYPGVTFDREYASLSLLMTLFAVIAEDKDSSVLAKKIDVTTVNNLLNAFLSSWDKSRRTSADLMIKLPRPWPGYGSARSINPLIMWAKRLAESARLRESDAGAQVLCSLFTVYSMELGWKLFDGAGSSQIGAEQSMDEFLFFLQGSVENTLIKLEKIFQAVASQSIETSDLNKDDVEADFPLVHGMLLAIKLCLLTMHKKGFFAAGKISDRWTVRMGKLLELTNRALELAMTVVAEAKSDVQFAPRPIPSSDGQPADVLVAKGPVNPATAYNMAASYVNTNSFTTVTDGEGDADSASGNNDLGAKAQRAIVAAWLLVKESTALLACLVDISPIPSANLTSEEVVLLSAENIEDVGRVLLDALGRLKHMGAIAEAHVALQAVATTLLRYGDKNAMLSRLPLTWLQQLLQRLFSHQQVFILRRSAGFAYSFLSLLRAEPANCTPVLLHTAMTALLQIIEKGLLAVASGNMEVDEEVWKLSVHALNVTRLILLDGAFGADLDQYIPKTLMLAVTGFTSNQWSVRNSSMMVFSATVQRTISREKNDSGGSSSVVADEFFNRYQGLLPFLQERLAQVTQSYEEGGFDGDTNDSLYPLLLLFAKFRAPMFSANVEEGANSAQSAALISMQDVAQTFLPLIARCTKSKVAYVRHMAARAYSALIPITETPSYLNQWAFAFDMTLRSTGGPRMSANAMHGSLAQCVEMLKQIVKHKQQAQDSTNSFFSQIESQLFRQENGCFQMLQKFVRYFAAFPCPPIHLLLINTFLSLKEIVVQAESHLLLDNMLVQESKVIIALFLSKPDADIVAALRDNSYAPWTLREALSIFINNLLQQGTAEFFAYLPLLLHPVSEVREGFGQGMVSFIMSQSGSVSSLTLLSNFEFISMVIAGLEQETEPVLLEIFLSLTQQIFLHLGSELFVGQLDNKLRLITILMNILLKSSKSSFQVDKVISSLEMKAGSCLALETLSVLVAPLLFDCLSAKDNVDSTCVHICQRWIELVCLAAHEEQPVDLRLSAAKSIEQSGILSLVQKPDCGKDEFLKWSFQSLMVVMDLLQDDDDDIREFINELVCAVHANASSSSSILTTSASSTLLDQFVVITQRFLQNCHTLGHRGFVESCQEVLFLKLVQYMGEEGKVESLLSSMFTAPLQQAQALSSKIFEAEQANLYLEKLQAGKAILSILFGSSQERLPLSKNVHGRILQILRSGLTMAKDCITMTANKDMLMIGGSSYDFEVYHYLFFCNLLLSYHLDSAEDLISVQVKEIQALMVQYDLDCKLHPYLKYQLRTF